MNFLNQINSEWTLFLDRDGVINEKKEGGYISEVEEFVLFPTTADALNLLSLHFGLATIVTNQQGIGKGLMDELDLQTIHAFMMSELGDAANFIDAIYFAPQLETDKHPYRKPGIGMGEQAKKDFPEIDFQKSVMVGDSETDIEFAQKLGMFSVFIGPQKHAKADISVPSLLRFAEMVKQAHE